jgi:hypothetical protein
MAAPVPTSTLSDFDPAYYGLPDIIAGYQILAVETSENVACMPSGMMKLVLRASSPDSTTFLNQTPDITALERTLKTLYPNPAHWDFEFVGPGISEGALRQTLQQWNPNVMHVCIRL